MINKQFLISLLKDKDGNPVTPYVLIDSIFDKSGAGVKSVFQEINDRITNLTNSLKSVSFTGYVTEGKLNGTNVGSFSTAEGKDNTVTSINSHGEGLSNIISGNNSHSEGSYNSSTGLNSHSEGNGNVASGESSHASGINTKAIGKASFSGGIDTEARGESSFAIGKGTVASDINQVVLGSYNLIQSVNPTKSATDHAFIIGNGVSNDARSNSMSLTWDGTLDVAKWIKINGKNLDQVAINGYVTKGIKSGFTAAETATAEGGNNISSGNYSHSEGYGCSSTGDNSHSEGNGTISSGLNSHSEGNNTTASSESSHAEGKGTVASGMYSHAQNLSCQSVGLGSSSSGGNSIANGNYSNSNNYYTIAKGYAQTVIGKYNIAQGTETSASVTDHAFIIGNGTSDVDRNNSLSVTWDGTLDVAKDIRINGSSVAKKTDVENKLTTPTETTITLLASSWIGSEAPFTYNLTINGIKPTSTIFTTAPTNTTKENLEILQSMNLQDGGQLDNTIVYKAFGEKPIKDVIIRLLISY